RSWRRSSAARSCWSCCAGCRAHGTLNGGSTWRRRNRPLGREAPQRRAAKYFAHAKAVSLNGKSHPSRGNTFVLNESALPSRDNAALAHGRAFLSSRRAALAHGKAFLLDKKGLWLSGKGFSLNRCTVLAHGQAFLLNKKGLPLNKKGLPFNRKAVRSARRRQLVDRFNRDPACRVFLGSLKAGGTED